MINSGDSTFETNGMFVTHHHFHHPQQHDMVNFSQSFHLILYHLPSLQLMQHNHQQVVKVIWHKAASPPNMDGSVVFARWRLCAHHTWQHPLVAVYWQYLHFVSRPLKAASITNSPVAIVHRKPVTVVTAILLPKLVAIATSLRTSKSAMSSSDSLTL